MIPRVMKPSKEILTLDDLTPSVITLPCIATEKIDGIGVRGINGNPYSCSNKVLPNLILQDLWDNAYGELNGIQGELHHPDGFHATQRVVMSQTGRIKGLKLHVYDSFDNAETPYIHRLKDLVKRVHKVNEIIHQVQVVSSQICTSIDDIRKFYKHIISNGGEGLVLRDPNAPYEFRRVPLSSGISIKLKPFADAEAIVVGVECQQSNSSESFVAETGLLKKTKRKDDLQDLQMVGAFVCRDLKGREFRVSCSTISHAEKGRLWQVRNTLIGSELTYTYLNTGEKDLPRSPKFLRWVK